MRALAIFAFIQITGILGGPITPQPDQTQNEEFDKLQVLRNLINSFKSRDFYDFPVWWIAQGKAKCRMIGGIEAANAAVEGLETYRESLIQLMNDTQLQLETVANTADTGLDFAVQRACHWFTIDHTLINNLRSSLTSCWSTEERTSANLLHQISSALLQYACKDEGNRILDFLNADGAECLDSWKFHIKSCLETSFSSNTSIFVDDTRDIIIPWGVPVITLNTQACREFGTLQKCVVRALGRCENQTPSHQINSMFDIVMTESGCEAFLEEEISTIPNEYREV